MGSMIGPELVEYGSGGKAHWGQVQCAQCGAWLREMPDSYKTSLLESEEQDREYIYFWTCLACGHVRQINSLSSPDEHTPNPEAELYEPGTFPPPVIRDPEKWDAADTLSPAKKLLVRCCWEMSDSLEGQLTVHKINYVWDLVKALEAQDIEAVIRSARAYVDLLDYEAIHGPEDSSYCGAEGDVTDIRSALLLIEKETSTQ